MSEMGRKRGFDGNVNERLQFAPRDAPNCAIIVHKKHRRITRSMETVCSLQLCMQIPSCAGSCNACLGANIWEYETNSSYLLRPCPPVWLTRA